MIELMDWRWASGTLPVDAINDAPTGSASSTGVAEGLSRRFDTAAVQN